MTKVLSVSLAVGIFACSSVSAQTGIQPPPGPRLAAAASAYTLNDPSMGEDTFMGAVLVARGDDVLLNQGYGMADLEWGRPNAPDVKFRLGSLTKQFTATLILMLQDDGKLQLSDPIGKYMPNIPKSWLTISIAQLLGHVSGIPNFTRDERYKVWRMSPHTADELLAFIEAKPLDFEPGSKFAYSNSNYEILGAILEKVSGQTYGEMLKRRIFQPLGMKDSGLDSDELILTKRAQGYKLSANGLVQSRSESMTVPWAAGSIYSTTGDLLLWEQGLFGGKLISATSLKQMIAPGKGGYGLGVFISNRNGHVVIDHGGTIEGFETYLAYEPDDRIAVAVLSNVSGVVPDLLGPQLLDVASGKPVVLPTEHKPMPISPGQLRKYEGQFRSPRGSIIVIARGEKGLTLKGSAGAPPGALYDLTYEGTQSGRARFYVSARYLEIEIVPDAAAPAKAVILHYLGGDETAQRQ